MKTIIYSILFLVVSNSVQSQWIQRYNGTGNTDDIAYSTAVDTSGNVYVTGKSKGIGTGFDYATIKYNSTGVQQWVARYNGLWNNSDIPTSIAVDGSGNVYVTGGSADTLTSIDYATVKYNSSGVQQWVIRYNGPGNGIDWANAISVDGSGNVYVTGSSTGTTTKRDFATIKYNSSGVLQWIQRFNGPVNSDDVANSISLDGSGNVYVAGGGLESNASTDYAVIKYNNSGVQQWVRRYNGQRSSADIISAMTVDGFGNVYVTGRSRVATIDYLTIKYNTNGDLLWSNVYNGTGNYEDMASSVKVDVPGNVYVTGQSYGSVSNFDYVTLKLNSSGVQQWVQRYNGTGNGSDCATSLAIDATGNAYVTGKSWGGSNDDYVTLKYNSSGIQQWVQIYNGTGNGDDRAAAVLLNKTGNVYVTGRSKGTGIYFDYATLKYLNGNAPTVLPSISVTPVQINAGSSIGITGQNFRGNVQIKVYVISSNSQVVLNQFYPTNSSGIFSANYSSSISSSPGIYTVSAVDTVINQSAPSRTFEVKEQPDTSSIVFLSPVLDSADNEVTIEWKDKMKKGIGYTLDSSGVKRNYKYTINYTTDNGNSWSEDFIVEGKENVNSTPILSSKISLPPLANSTSVGTCKIRVKDFINPARLAESPNLPRKNSMLTKSTFDYKWDFHSKNSPVNPKGVCADGVSRIYLNVRKMITKPNLSSVNIKLSDDKFNDDKKVLGKLMVANVKNDSYSQEANNANQINITCFDPVDNWVWYVSPDDFVRQNSNDVDLSERIVKVTVKVNYADATIETGTYNIIIIRPPLLLVHGFSSDPSSCWRDFHYISNSQPIYFYNSPVFKFGGVPNIDSKESFKVNADYLLNVNQLDNTHNSIYYYCVKAIKSGYASNQVFYIGHSMGGCVIREAEKNTANYYSEYNYGKGYVNKLITIDTPHLGSPIADIVNGSLNFVNYFLPSYDFISYMILKGGVNLFNSSFKFGPSGNILSTNAILNMRSSKSVINKFTPTQINPHYFIASDGYLGTGIDIDSYNWNCSSNINDFNDYKDFIKSFILFYSNPLIKAFHKKVNDLYNEVSSNGNNSILESDFVVPIYSQLDLGTINNNQNTFDNYQGSNNCFGIFHTIFHSCTSAESIGNRTFELLNLPSSSSVFTKNEPFSSVSSIKSSNTKQTTFNNSVPIILNTLNIISPAQNETGIVGNLLNVDLTLSDTTNLKNLTVYFQGENYYDSTKSFSYNFNITINAKEIDTCLLTAQAIYNYQDTIKYSYNKKKIIVKNLSSVIDFKINNNFLYLLKNNSVTPQFKIVFSNDIFSGIPDNISANVNNPSVVLFNSSNKSFTAISAGETFATVSYGGKSDTVYFVVSGEQMMPGNSTLLSPADSALVPVSNLVFKWNKSNYASNYYFQIASDINFQDLVYKESNLTETSVTVPNLDDSLKYYWRVKAVNSVGSGNWSSPRSFTPLPIGTSYLSLTIIPQGFYDEVTNKLQRRDTIKVYLMKNISPYNVIDSTVSVIDSVTYQGIFEFSNAPTGTYYYKINHLNSIETWSKAGGEIFKNLDHMEYSFVNSISKAYGNNMILKGTKYCLFSGDVNQDEVIDASDLSEVDNDAYNSVSGYVRTDLTGDDFVDAADVSIVDNNAYNSISVIRP